MTNSYIWLLLFGAILYLMIMDENITKYVILLIEYLSFYAEKKYLMIKLHPFWFTNPISQRIIMKKYEKEAQKLLTNHKP
jgi:hypothetical protein